MHTYRGRRRNPKSRRRPLLSSEPGRRSPTALRWSLHDAHRPYDAILETMSEDRKVVFRLKLLFPALRLLHRFRCLLSASRHCCPPSHEIMADVVKYGRESTRTAFRLHQHNEKNSDSTEQSVIAECSSRIFPISSMRARNTTTHTMSAQIFSQTSRSHCKTSHEIRIISAGSLSHRMQNKNKIMRARIQIFSDDVRNACIHTAENFFQKMPRKRFAPAGFEQKRANQ